MQHRRAAQRRLTAGTNRRPMLDDYVGLGHHPKRLAAMAQLPTGFLAARASQALRFTCEPVARQRVVTFVAVLGPLCFQLLHPSEQLRHLLAQHRQFAHLRSQRAFSTSNRAIRASGVLPLGYTCCTSLSDLLRES